MSKQKFSRSNREEQGKAAKHNAGADLSLAISAARFGVWSIDLNSQLVHWSQSMFELAPEVFRGREPSLDLYLSAVHSDDRASVTQALERCVRENKSFKVRHRFVNGDQTIWIEGAGQILQDSSGTAIRIVGSCHDISERVQVESKMNCF